MTDLYTVGAEYAARFESREEAWEYALQHDPRLSELVSDADTHVSDMGGQDRAQHLSLVTPHLAEHTKLSDAAENFARGFHGKSGADAGLVE